MWLVPRPLCDATVSASEPSKRATSSTATATASAPMPAAAVIFGHANAHGAERAELLHDL